MEEIINNLTAEEESQLSKLISEGNATIKKALEQMARDDEEIERIRRRSDLMLAHTQEILARMESR